MKTHDMNLIVYLEEKVEIKSKLSPQYTLVCNGVETYHKRYFKNMIWKGFTRELFKLEVNIFAMEIAARKGNYKIQRVIVNEFKRQAYIDLIRLN